MIKHIGVAVLVGLAFFAGTLVPVASTQPASLQGTGEFIVVNYMKVPPGRGADYVAMERTLYKASHQARVKDGKLKSWALWQLRFGGTEDPYTFATVNTYGKWEDLEVSNQDYLLKSNPGKELADIQRQTQAAREISRTEVWRVLDQTR